VAFSESWSANEVRRRRFSGRFSSSSIRVERVALRLAINMGHYRELTGLLLASGFAVELAETWTDDAHSVATSWQPVAKGGLHWEGAKRRRIRAHDCERSWVHVIRSAGMR
jgi:hypothetical protein